jgi:hypothetical protein
MTSQPNLHLCALEETVSDFNPEFNLRPSLKSYTSELHATLNSPTRHPGIPNRSAIQVIPPAGLDTAVTVGPTRTTYTRTDSETASPVC